MDNIKIHKSCEAMCITVSAFNDKNLNSNKHLMDKKGFWIQAKLV